MSPFFAEQARTKAEGKRLNANLKEFGNDKMAELVKNNRGTEYEYECNRNN
jgi:hypothetical protein